MSSTETSPASTAGSFPLSVTPKALQTVQSRHPPGQPGSSELPPGVMAGLIIGIVIGGIAMLVLVCIFVVFYKRWKQKKRKQPPLQIHNSRGSSKHSITAEVHDQQLQMKPSPLADLESAMLPSPTGPFPEFVLSSTSETSLTASSEDSEKQLPQSSSPKIVFGLSQSMFTYEVLAMATNDFSDANLLGQGGFGYVHKGVLPDGKVVAIKQLKDGSKQGEREFRAEVEVIGCIHHRHLVSLVGYCICGNQRMLVYEFVPNDTLEFHLHGKGRPTMNWPTRMKIALGSARGLAYLHKDCQPRIIHRDIKASNILLDNNFEAKVADFGLAKCYLDTDTHVSTRVLGTFGYLAPEYASSGRLTDKSDVFSFGVVLLELITGCHPVDVTQPFLNDGIVDWARPLLNQALGSGNFDPVIDSRLQNDYDSNEITRMIACAAACVRHSARLRPQMSQVVRALEGNMPLVDLGDGIAPGQSTDYDISQYKEDLAKFRKLVLESQEHGTSWSYEPSSEDLN